MQISQHIPLDVLQLIIDCCPIEVATRLSLASQLLQKKIESIVEQRLLVVDRKQFPLLTCDRIIKLIIKHNINIKAARISVSNEKKENDSVELEKIFVALTSKACNLEELFCIEYHPRNITSLVQNCTQLKSLHLLLNPDDLIDWSELTKLQRLERFFPNSTKLTKSSLLCFLNCFSSLKELHLPVCFTEKQFILKELALPHLETLSIGEAQSSWGDNFQDKKLLQAISKFTMITSLSWRFYPANAFFSESDYIPLLRLTQLRSYSRDDVKSIECSVLAKMTQLQHLHLTRIHQYDIQKLLIALPNLVSLEIGNNHDSLNNRFLEELSEHPHLQSVKMCDHITHKFSPKGINQLLESKTLRKIEINPYPDQHLN